MLGGRSIVRKVRGIDNPRVACSGALCGTCNREMSDKCMTDLPIATTTTANGRRRVTVGSSDHR